jgi:Tfp pilus assembly protein PilN
MPIINLIETQILAKKREESQLRISKYTLIGTTTIVGLSYFFLAAQGVGLNGQLNEVEAKLKKTRPLQEQIDALKKEESNLDPRLQTLQNARLLTNRWANLLGHLAVNTPSEVWLTSFRSIATDPEKPIHITFNGVGRSQTDVSEMVMRTQNAQDLESVNLVGSQEKLFEKVSGTEFEMSGDIVDTAEKKRKSVNVDKEEKL